MRERGYYHIFEVREKTESTAAPELKNDFVVYQVIQEADLIIYDHYLETMPNQIQRLQEEQLARRR